MQRKKARIDERNKDPNSMILSDEKMVEPEVIRESVKDEKPALVDVEPL